MADRPILDEDIESPQNFSQIVENDYNIIEYGIDYDGEGDHIRNRESELLALFESGFRPFCIYYRGSVKFWGLHKKNEDSAPLPPQPLGE